MPIDPNIVTQQIDRLKLNQQSRAEAILKDTMLQAQRTVTALVKSTVPASQRQIEALLQHPKNSKSDSARQILNSPTLRLAELELKNQKLLIFTDKPIKAGEKFELIQKNNLLQVEKKIAPRLDSKNSAPSKPAEPTIESKALVSALRSALPIHKPIIELLNQLKPIRLEPLISWTPLKINTAQGQPIEKIGESSIEKLLNTLKPLLEGRKTPSQISTPEILKSEINKSGLLLEKKLVEIFKELSSIQKNEVRTIPPQEQSGTLKTTNKLNTDNQPNRSNLIRNLLYKSLGANNKIEKMSYEKMNNEPLFSKSRQQSISLSESTIFLDKKNSITNDVKAILLKSKILVDEYFISLEKENYSREQVGSLLPKKNIGKTTSLDSLIKQWLGKGGDKTTPDSTEKIMVLLREQIISGLARLQLQQTIPLSQQIASPEAPQQFNLEIPVRINSEFYNVELHFEEEWVEKEGEKNSGGKTKLWSVLLTLDLPDAGSLYARVRMLGESDNQVSVCFWAQHQATLDQVEARLQTLHKQLHQQGINIKELQCLNGTPKKKSISFEYALVDIKT